MKEEYISQKEMERRTKRPLLGYATKKGIMVRKDLNPEIRKFVRQHELEHVKRFKEGKSQPTWFREEALVSIKAFPKQPIGGVLTVLRSISDPRRFKYYWETYKENSPRRKKGPGYKKKKLFSRSKKYYQKNGLKPGFIESSGGAGAHSVFTLGTNSYNFGGAYDDAGIDKGDPRRQEDIWYRKPLRRDIYKEPEYESVKKLKRENPELFWKIRKGEYTPSVNHVGQILSEEFNLAKRKYQSGEPSPYYRQQKGNCTKVASATADLFGFNAYGGECTGLTSYDYDNKAPKGIARTVGNNKGLKTLGKWVMDKDSNGEPILMPKGEYKILVPNTEGQVEDNIRDSYKTFGFARRKKVSVKPHKRQLGKKTVKVKGYKKIVHTKKKVKGK